jgi:HAD superfamily hydrolase (TIGR01549 family)
VSFDTAAFFELAISKTLLQNAGFFVTVNSIMALKVVLFDLGDTLINYGKVDVEALLTEAAHLTHRYLLECTGEQETLRNFRQYYRRTVTSIKWRYFWSNVTQREFNGLVLLERNLGKMGIQVSREHLEELSWLWYKPLSEKATIEGNLHEHLQRLRDIALELAIISNTFSPPSVLDRHLEQLDLLRFFPVRQYSSVTVFRKPDRRIFELTLRRLNVSASEAVMVGDRMRQDIKGAQRLGITGVFKRNSINGRKKIANDIPVIETIAELPELIGGWQRNTSQGNLL